MLDRMKSSRNRNKYINFVHDNCYVIPTQSRITTCAEFTHFTVGANEGFRVILRAYSYYDYYAIS